MVNRKPQRKRTLAESTYVPELLRGLAITARHAVRSLLDPEAAITVEFPEVRKPMTPRFKGAHRLLRRADGKLRCVACMCCPTVCPAKCITIVAGEDPEDPAEKVPVRFEIDMLRCIYCGYCVEACPKDAIRMDTGVYDLNAARRQDLVHGRAFLDLLNDRTELEAGAWYLAHPEAAPPGVRPDAESGAGPRAQGPGWLEPAGRTDRRGSGPASDGEDD